MVFKIEKAKLNDFNEFPSLDFFLRRLARSGHVAILAESIEDVEVECKAKTFRNLLRIGKKE